MQSGLSYLKQKDPDKELHNYHYAEYARYLRWLLDFINFDLEQTTTRECEDLCNTISTIKVPVRPGINLISTHIRPESIGDLKDVQKKVKDIFDTLIPLNKDRGESYSLTIPSRFRLIWFSKKGKPQIRLQSMLQTGWGAYWLFLGELLETFGDRLYRCQECKKVFFKTKRQAYCSKRCSQSTRTKRWYKAHRKEVLEKRHQIYVEQVKRKHGLNIKVKQRKKILA